MVDRILSTNWQRARGVIGRYPSEDERFILRWPDAKMRPIHMVGVRRPLRVTWCVAGEVKKQAVLEAWSGKGRAVADEVIEEPYLENRA